MSARKRNSPPIIHRGMARVWSNHRPVVSEIETRIRTNDALYRMQLAYKRDFSLSLSSRLHLLLFSLHESEISAFLQLRTCRGE